MGLIGEHLAGDALLKRFAENNVLCRQDRARRAADPAGSFPKFSLPFVESLFLPLLLP